jgi:hypothetical protein
MNITSLADSWAGATLDGPAGDPITQVTAQWVVPSSTPGIVGQYQVATLNSSQPSLLLSPVYYPGSFGAASLIALTSGTSTLAAGVEFGIDVGETSHVKGPRPPREPGPLGAPGMLMTGSFNPEAPKSSEEVEITYSCSFFLQGFFGTFPNPESTVPFPWPFKGRKISAGGVAVVSTPLVRPGDLVSVSIVLSGSGSASVEFANITLSSKDTIAISDFGGSTLGVASQILSGTSSSKAAWIVQRLGTNEAFPWFGKVIFDNASCQTSTGTVIGVDDGDPKPSFSWSDYGNVSAITKGPGVLMVQGICAQSLPTTVPPNQVIILGGEEVGTGKKQHAVTYLYVGDITQAQNVGAWQKLGYDDPHSTGPNADRAFPSFTPLDGTELAGQPVHPSFPSGAVPFPS